MEYLPCDLINRPIATFNIVANAFYIVCMVCPLNGEKMPNDIMAYVVKTHVILSLCVMALRWPWGLVRLYSGGEQWTSGSEQLDAAENNRLNKEVYLCGHMRRMVANGQPVSHPRLRSQVRVTVTGILQGVLYLICSVWTLYEFLPLAFIDPTTHFTVINLYMSGTTVALGVGQAVFRQRAADIWLRAVQCCREQQTEQGG
ncbi:hypothetical protein JOQ06_029982, partial [Pogonophryne albipinna]